VRQKTRHAYKNLTDIALRPLVAGRETPVIHALLCSTDYGILMTDPRGTDILCNPRFGELFDIDPEVVVRSKREEVRRMALARVKDPDEFVALIERIYADPTIEHEDEIALNTDPPRILRRYTSPVFDAQGENIGRVWTFQDVTETRQLQAEVESYAARLQEQFQQQADDLRDTMQVFNAITRISAAITSRHELPMFVQALTEIVRPLLPQGRAAVLLVSGASLCGTLCAPDSPPRALEVSAESEPAVAAALSEEGLSSLPILQVYDNAPLARAMGCATVVVAPVRWLERTMGIMALGTDQPSTALKTRYLDQLRAVVVQVSLAIRIHQGRTELQTAYDELRAAQGQMVESAKLGAVGTLAASIAHDIRNIMTPLQMELAMATPSPSLTAARAQVDRLSALTHRLLALSRPKEIHPGPVCIKEVLTHILPLIQPQADIDGVAIRTRFEQDLPRVQGDSGRLEHLFINLFLNALHAMAQKGGTLTVAAAPDNGQVRVDVKDTGKGIEPEHLSRLFDAFFTTRANGSGLGLFSVKRIVEEHNGRVSVQSKVGKGTCFSVWLPTAE